MLQCCLPSPKPLYLLLAISLCDGTTGGQRRGRHAWPRDIGGCFLESESTAYQAVSGPCNKIAYFTLWPTIALFILCISELGNAIWRDGKNRELGGKNSDLTFCLYRFVRRVSLWASPLISLRLSFFPSNENNNFWPISFQGYSADDKRVVMYKSLSSLQSIKDSSY